MVRKRKKQQSDLHDMAVRVRGWLIDKDGDNRSVQIRLKRKILSEKTEFQKVEIYDSHEFGIIVMLDGKVQSSEKDEFIYHEALVHPGMLLHPKPQSVLILGGGEGATLREVFRHRSVGKAVMVDIDKKFVDICSKYLKPWHKGSFKNPKTSLLFTDAVWYLKKTNDRFDVVIADISDPVEEGPARSAYTKKFYQLIQNVLSQDGIFVTHTTEIGSVNTKGISKKIFRSLRSIFPYVTFYYEYIPSFGCLWGYALCSQKYKLADLPPDIITRRIRRRKLGILKYYDQETHQRIFSISKNVKNLIRGKEA
jgi:spermidine synthase